MQKNPAAEQSKIIIWSESSWNQSGRKGKGLWRKGLEFRMKYWRVREDASGDSKDDEDIKSMLDPISINFTFTTSKPAQSALLNHRADWLQFQQFSQHETLLLFNIKSHMRSYSISFCNKAIYCNCTDKLVQ